ncbi:MAG: phosphoribosyltransferase family protein [Thermodesulfobacteriota bacterium]
MQAYQEELAKLLAESGALFFRQGLTLKDGRPTPYFFNLGVLRTGRLSIGLGRCFADWFMAAGLAGKVDVLLGPSYKGSALAQAMAIALWERHGVEIGFDYDRKEQKTHGEASGKAAMFVTGALKDGARVLIIDDVGTSMATKVELLDKLNAQAKANGERYDLLGVVLAVDREQVQAVYDQAGRVVVGARGPDALAGFTAKTGLAVWPLIGIRACVDHLHQIGLPVMVEGRRRPLDDGLLNQVRDYLAMYGREA